MKVIYGDGVIDVEVKYLCCFMIVILYRYLVEFCLRRGEVIY